MGPCRALDRILTDWGCCMSTGACAGTAAVLASMPADCVKTQIELSAVRAPGGLLPDLALFGGTARSLIRHGGVGALFRGMGPRLADKVPSTMVSIVPACLVAGFASCGCCGPYTAASV